MLPNTNTIILCDIFSYIWQCFRSRRFHWQHFFRFQTYKNWYHCTKREKLVPEILELVPQGVKNQKSYHVWIKYGSSDTAKGKIRIIVMEILQIISFWLQRGHREKKKLLIHKIFYNRIIVKFVENY